MLLRLKAIKLGVDFRRTESFNLAEFQKSSSFPGALAKNEVFLFVSMTGSQLLWILHSDEHVIDSRKWRLLHGAWNPQLLQDYAACVGIQLQGIKSFAQQFEAYKASKKA